MVRNPVRSVQCQFTRAIAKAIDIDPDKYPIRKIVITADVNAGVEAQVTMFISKEQDPKIAEIVKQYKLVSPLAFTPDEEVQEESWLTRPSQL